MLEKINSPDDIKKLNIDELGILAQDIRDFIIESVSQKGGHLASSLGAVEICLALHYCMNTPEDAIIFDVGHQAYAHKIITGRKNEFIKLREYKGISGFPDPKESVHDVYISGHASTAVSWAQGISEAKKIKKNSSKTVAVIGDGSLTGGMCFEALNHCGHSQSDILVILNHNEMSISSSVGALSNYLTKILSLPIYNRIRHELEDFLKKLPPFAKKFAHAARKFEEALKSIIVPGVFFEELGFRYFGPLKGHDLSALIPNLRNILPLKGPKILHVITIKGKGYKFAEDNAEEFHGASRFSVKAGDFIKKNEISFSQVMGEKLTSLAGEDNRVVAITAAMTRGTGLGVFKEKYPQRFFDVGIAEQHAVGFASGLAKQGLRPFVAIYSTFLQRSLDQVIHDVALQNVPVTFCIDRAGLVGEDGPTHHGVFDIGYLKMVPGIVCMAPKDKQELEDMIEFSLELDCPVSIRYPKGEAYSLAPGEKIILGKAQVLNKGKDVCIMAIGSTVREAVAAAEILEKRGINAFLVNARFIKPIDKDILAFIGDNFGLICTVEENVLSGGFGSSVLDFYGANNYLDRIKVKRFGIPDEFSTFASRKELFKIYGLDGESLADSIGDILKKQLSGKTKLI